MHARSPSSLLSRTSEWRVDGTELQIVHRRLDVCAIAASNDYLRDPQLCSCSVGGRQIVKRNIYAGTTGGMGREPKQVEDP